MPKPRFSFEFFPPRDKAQERRFWYTLGRLEGLSPTTISMTWGALGSGSAASMEVLKPLVKETRLPVTAHLSCAGQNQEQMRRMIKQLKHLGIQRFLALRGDLEGERKAARESQAGMMQHASDLVALLAEDPNLDISVAAYPEAHPESPSAESDIHWLKHKLDAGAKRAITQFFFKPETFLKFRDRCVAAGIEQPLVPGILPVHNIDKVCAFSARCGAEVPEAILTRFQGAQDQESRQALAVEHAVALCDHLLREGVEAFHIYTLNNWVLSQQVVQTLTGELEGKSRHHLADFFAAA